jgi:hypothetical protein
MPNMVPAGLSPAELVAHIVSGTTAHNAAQSDVLKREALGLGPDDPIPAYKHQDYPKMIEVAAAPATPEAPAIGQLVTVNSAAEAAQFAPPEAQHG